MNAQSLKQSLEALAEFQQTVSAYHHAMGVMELDASTCAPSGSWEGRGKTMGVLSKVTYTLTTDPRNAELLACLEANTEKLTEQQRREVEVLRKQYDQFARIPMEEYVAYSVLSTEAQSVWVKAKQDNDFASFAPYLEKIVSYQRKFAGYMHPEMEAYNAMLHSFEEGLTTDTLDAFFAQLRDTIVPLLARVREAAPIDDSFLYAKYPVAQQRELAQYLMDVLGMDKRYSALAESEHPFTTGFNNKDVRITTHYYENNLVSSIFSVIHEGGHALYELGAEDRYNHTVLSGGASMGIHESQSRFYENLVGRSLPFIQFILPKLKELFPEQLADVDAFKFYRAVNKAEAGLIRTEADELTYCLHIMVRYELEKQLVRGTLEVKDLPQAWNRMYKEYLGVDVPDDSRGCLQDTHWSGGMIGYFPSYALGSAYGPQMMAKLREDIGDVEQDLAAGDLSRITAWLGEKIHRHAGFYKPGALFEQVCGKFDAKYYTDYLTEKYTELYQL